MRDRAGLVGMIMGESVTGDLLRSSTWSGECCIWVQL
jgi:hypothetical protein